jgi:DNA-binding MarR family transcriptional regulator
MDMLEVLLRDSPATGSQSLAALLEQVARSVHGLCFHDGLHPVQWSALRFFARAPSRDRTVSGLALHLGVTQPPASRTVSALVARGALTAEVDANDRRSKRVSLTRAGEALLLHDPIQRVGQVIQTLDPVQLAALGSILDVLQARLVLELRGGRTPIGQSETS